jgi:hypothetical protein
VAGLVLLRVAFPDATRAIVNGLRLLRHLP